MCLPKTFPHNSLENRSVKCPINSSIVTQTDRWMADLLLNENNRYGQSTCKKTFCHIISKPNRFLWPLSHFLAPHTSTVVRTTSTETKSWPRLECFKTKTSPRLLGVESKSRPRLRLSQAKTHRALHCIQHNPMRNMLTRIFINGSERYTFASNYKLKRPLIHLFYGDIQYTCMYVSSKCTMTNHVIIN